MSEVDKVMMLFCLLSVFDVLIMRFIMICCIWVGLVMIGGRLGWSWKWRVVCLLIEVCRSGMVLLMSGLRLMCWMMKWFLLV